MDHIINNMLLAMRMTLKWAILIAFLNIILFIAFSFHIHDVTQAFVERVRYEGYITEEMYLEYLGKMQFNEISIYMRHTEEKRTLDEPSTIAHRVNILKKVFGNEGIYTFQEGDQFVLGVTARIFMLETKIQAGGLILNEKYH